MAKSTTNKKPTNKKVEKVEEIVEKEKIEEIEEVKSESSEATSEVDLLKQQLEEMKKAMAELMVNKANEGSNRIIVKEQEDEVVIGCRVLQGIGWGSPDDPAGEIRLSYNDKQTVTVTDMKRFFRQASIRKLFEDGLCYFAKPEDYALFNIRKYVDLSNENLLRILDKKDINEIIRELDKLTQEKKNSGIVNCLIYRICNMIKNKELVWDYYTQAGIEKYFNMEFSRGINILQSIENIRR